VLQKITRCRADAKIVRAAAAKKTLRGTAFQMVAAARETNDSFSSGPFLFK
jgi:hypothetical protein